MRKPHAFRALSIIAAAGLLLATSCVLVDQEDPMMESTTRTFDVIEVLDGQWAGGPITITTDPTEPGIEVIGKDTYDAPVAPTGAGAIQMVLAFQLAPGKSREDFAKFKELDFPWVCSNRGSNRATIWTRRTNDWPFDAFEDVTFASKKDFERAYAGNDDLSKAGEGLFGDKVLAAIVEED